jgi:hypothetical protein
MGGEGENRKKVSKREGRENQKETSWSLPSLLSLS